MNSSYSRSDWNGFTTGYPFNHIDQRFGLFAQDVNRATILFLTTEERLIGPCPSYPNPEPSSRLQVLPR